MQGVRPRAFEVAHLLVRLGKVAERDQAEELLVAEQLDRGRAVLDPRLRVPRRVGEGAELDQHLPDPEVIAEALIDLERRQPQ